MTSTKLYEVYLNDLIKLNYDNKYFLGHELSGVLNTLISDVKLNYPNNFNEKDVKNFIAQSLQ